MTEPGLNNRLRQHSRRAGIMVGFSMALTIALLIGSFAYIYAKVDPFTRDFVDAATITPTSEPGKPTNAPDDMAADLEPTDPADSGGDAVPTDEPAETPTTQPSQPTATSGAFKATHTVVADVRINLRPGPAVASGDPVGTLDPGTDLQYLDDRKPSSDPDADGATEWLKFRTESGDIGWVREIDVEAINAGQ